MRCINHHHFSGTHCHLCDTAPIKKERAKIKPMTKKLKANLKEYLTLKFKFISENYTCQVEGCQNESQDIHHKKGRGVHLNDTANFLAVCRDCHIKIEMNPTWAKSEGYSKSRLC